MTSPDRLTMAELALIEGNSTACYGVETRVLVQAVKRNLARFPEDFMFQLSAEEFAGMMTAPGGRGGKGGAGMGGGGANGFRGGR